MMKRILCIDDCIIACFSSSLKLRFQNNEEFSLEILECEEFAIETKLGYSISHLNV